MELKNSHVKLETIGSTSKNLMNNAQMNKETAPGSYLAGKFEMSLSSIKHLRDNESMFTRTKNLHITESTYLDSAPQRQTQARIKPLGEKRYFESTQQSEKGLRSTLTEIHKSRA